MNIKKGDTVVVISGADKYQIDNKGNKTLKSGKVLKANPKDNTVVVEGVNKVKKHLKPTQANQTGSIVEVEAPINVSKVAILDPKTNTPTRVSIKIDENGKKVRVTKKSGSILK